MYIPGLYCAAITFFSSLFWDFWSQLSYRFLFSWHDYALCYSIVFWVNTHIRCVATIHTYGVWPQYTHTVWPQYTHTVCGHNTHILCGHNTHIRCGHTHIRCGHNTHIQCGHNTHTLCGHNTHIRCVATIHTYGVATIHTYCVATIHTYGVWPQYSTQITKTQRLQCISNFTKTLLITVVLKLFLLKS